MPPWTGLSLGWPYSGHCPQPRQAPGTGSFLDFQGRGTRAALRCQEAAPGCPLSARAGSSAKGPGAVRFWRKGPQVGAAVAECERFRREITGDNPAQDGAARQETSSREPAAGRVGEGCRSLTALQPAGQPQGVGQRPHAWCLLPTHCPSPFRMHSLTPELWMGWREKPSSKVSSISKVPRVHRRKPQGRL